VTDFEAKRATRALNIWTMLEWDESAHRVAYLMVAPDSHVAHIQIHCQEKADHTQACVGYTLTALCEVGNTVVEQLTEEHYGQKMAHWQEAINHYLTTGETITVQPH